MLAQLAGLMCLSQSMSVWLLLRGRELVVATLLHLQPLLQTEIRGPTIEKYVKESAISLSPQQHGGFNSEASIAQCKPALW